MADESFYEKPTEASLTKQRIVVEYLDAWANIVLPTALRHEGRIAYVDMFCGPGAYEDGTESIPLKVLQLAISKPALRDNLQTFFNDEDKGIITKLTERLARTQGIETLEHKPVIRNYSISREIIPRVKKFRVPTLFFADPWGYQGVSLDLIEAVLSNWGSDFIFFFNYNRINMNLGNELMEGPINEFFTPEVAARLRKKGAWLKGWQREQAIVSEMMCEIKRLGAKCEKFMFRAERGARTTHYLMGVSRDRRGMEIFKEISARQSSRFDGNVASMDHSPGLPNSQYTLFSQIEELERDLMNKFAGKQLTEEEIYHEHHVGSPYRRANYREALFNLKSSGRIQVRSPNAERSLKGIPSNATIVFPDTQAG